MLEKIDTKKKMDKKEFKELMDQIQPEFALLQRRCKELGIPVSIVFEGFEASGKGTMIAKLIEPLDPRGFKVYSIDHMTEEEKTKPFLWRFFCKTPAKGRIAIFDRSWYTKVLRERFEKITKKEELIYAYDEINNFEKLLCNDGNIIIKFFLYITKEEQKKRFERLQEKKSTAWRVTKEDWDNNKHYEKYQKMYEEVIEKTDKDYAPWNIIEAKDKEYAAAKIYQIIMQRLNEACEEIEKRNKRAEEKKEISNEKEEYSDEIQENEFKNRVLSAIDLSKDIEKDEYKKKLCCLQERLSVLQEELYHKKISTVIAFEGWDAAGKGGAIKRVTQKLDPRAYEVIPIAAPDATEKSHHYLWRFNQHLPEAGHMVIFDRTWYGRVMVERIEGFCTHDEWSRAYSEINHFEEQLVNSGVIVIKFWLHIDKDEQKKRFDLRQNTPGKEWKITDEDWRNRAKWDEYELAIDEMLVRTSTTYAPWTVVEANSKMYARIKVLETIIHAIEERLK